MTVAVEFEYLFSLHKTFPQKLLKKVPGESAWIV
jgi:hypothetical protein